MFTRHKYGRGGPYLQVVESYRLGGHKRQRVLLHLGPYPDMEEALVRLPRRLDEARARADEGYALADRRYRRLLDTLDGDTFMERHGDDYLAILGGVEAALDEAKALDQRLARLNALVAKNPSLLGGAQQDEEGEPEHNGTESAHSGAETRAA